MIVRLSQVGKRLTLLPQAGCSYYENYTHKINPLPNAQLSYNNPKHHRTHLVQRHQVPLNKFAAGLIEESKFRKFKDRMIGVTKDVQYVWPEDPLWGDTPPKHYIENRPLTHYYRIDPYEQHESQQLPLPAELRFKPEVVENLTLDALGECSPFNIIQFALRQAQVGDREMSLKVFTKVEKLLERKLHLVPTLDIVRLKHALLGQPRFGTPELHQTLSSMITEEYSTLDTDGLLAAFVTFRFHSNNQVQNDILKKLLSPRHLAQIKSNPERLLNFIECYAKYRIPDWKKPRTKRVLNESRISAIEFLSKLPLEETVPYLNIDQKFRLLRSLLKMKLQGFRHIVYLINTSINEEELTPKQAAEYIFMLSKLENGMGCLTQQQLDTFKPILLEHWAEYNNLEKMKMVYVYWNSNCWEEFQPLYQEIPVEAHANLLYYFVQIEITDSSGREHEVVRAIAELETIPLPFYNMFKQFLVFADSFQWNLMPLFDKFEETENFVNVDRLSDSLSKDRNFVELGKFLLTMPIQVKHGIPVENFTLVQFAYENLLIGVEVIQPRDLAPNGTLRRSTVARNTTLESLDWHILQLNWSDFVKMPVQKRYEFFQSKMMEVVETQELKKTYREAKDSEEALFAAKAREFEFFSYEDYEAIMAEVRPSAENFQRVILGQEPVEDLTQKPSWSLLETNEVEAEKFRMQTKDNKNNKDNKDSTEKKDNKDNKEKKQKKKK